MNAFVTRKQLSPTWILVILTGLNLFNYLDRYVLSAVLTPLQKDLGINDGQAGRLVTAFMIGYFVTSPVFGWLGDRWSRKWLIAAGILVWSVGTVLTGFAATFAIMIGFRVLVGLGEASYATISPSLISDSYAPAKRNNALTIFYVAIPVGAALGTIIGGIIAVKWGWRHAFIWAGAPGLFLALVMLPFAELKRGQAEGKTTEAAKKPSVRDITRLFRIPDYVLVVLGYVDTAIASGAVGFLLKQASAHDVCRAIMEVHQGKVFFSPSISRRLNRLQPESLDRTGQPKKKAAQLTSREMEVLQLIAEGKANKETAGELGIGLKTVEKHREHLMQKLDIHDTAGLTRYAISAGIIESSVQLTIV